MLITFAVPANALMTRPFCKGIPGAIRIMPVPSAPTLISIFPSGAVASPHSMVSFTTDADVL